MYSLNTVSLLVHLVLLSLAHIIFSNTFTGSPSNIASTSKQPTSPFALFSRLKPVYLRSILHTHHSTRSLRLSNTNLLCAHSFILHLAPAVSVLQLLKSGTLSLRLFECVPAMIPFAINSRPTTSSWPSNQLSASSLAPQIRLWLTAVHCARLYVYKLYLLTYLLTYSSFFFIL